MSDTAKLVNQMFVNLVKLRLDDRIAKQAASVVDGVVDKVLSESPEATDETKRRIRIALCGMLAHGWALGMNPYNSPDITVDGKPLEVRVSKDILIPIESLKALRCVTTDKLGRVEKAFFEPSSESKVKERIDKILGEIARKHWAK
jgi:hypothetical protein